MMSVEPIDSAGHAQTAEADQGEDLEVISPDKSALEAHRIVGFYKHDQRSRPFSLLRTQIAKRIEDQSLKLIGVTSATPNAGKSFVALNLAASLARLSDDPIYLVDLDLRRGTLAQELGHEPETGVGDFLSGDIPSLDDIGWRLAGTRLNVLPTRAIKQETAELLSGQRFEDLITMLRERTGGCTVFCDLPPAFANDDAMITMEKLDGYILVVDSGVNNRNQIQNTLDIFAPKPCIGSVLNRYSGGLVDSYGYGYSKYGYGRSAYDKYY